jgi:hypothetical protein
MDVTCIRHTDWTKSLIYSIDPVNIKNWIEDFLYADIPEEKVKEVMEVTYDKVQKVLNNLF